MLGSWLGDCSRAVLHYWATITGGTDKTNDLLSWTCFSTVTSASMNIAFVCTPALWGIVRSSYIREPLINHQTPTVNRLESHKLQHPQRFPPVKVLRGKLPLQEMPQKGLIKEYFDEVVNAPRDLIGLMKLGFHLRCLYEEKKFAWFAL